MADPIPDLRRSRSSIGRRPSAASAGPPSASTRPTGGVHRIAALERAFGLTLINRGARHLSLSPKGHELLGYAERSCACTARWWAP